MKLKRGTFLRVMDHVSRITWSSESRLEIMSRPALSDSEYQELAREFSCSLCVEFFNDPVTSCCGHTFCRVCLDRVSQSARAAKCPICRKTLNSNVRLCRNVLLVNVMTLLGFNNADGTDSPDGNRNVVVTGAAAMGAAATSAVVMSPVVMSPVAMDTVNAILMEWLSTSAVWISTIQQLRRLYGCNVFLDINSVSPHLKLCDDDRTAEVTTKRQTYPEHPDR
uniref:RING-type domain-containing protein n=1 Tax=Eptatretus burgeri TaxID=7764 RepID=A0A8C4Q6U9_EPTBU